MSNQNTDLTLQEVRDLSAIELRDALRAGKVSATQAVKAYLDAIAAWPELGAFITVTEDQALEEAAKADALHARLAAAPEGEPGLESLPPLHGMPLAHKDLEDVRGVTTTFGSAAVPHVPAEADGPVASILGKAGAISLGKTQIPEFGLTNYSENAIAPPARNPLDPRRNPGGSSGGSAAAIAAGMLPFGPGSDGGGSVRIPALACGLIGLKPEFGTVAADALPGTHDAFGTPTLTVTGPIARTALDAAMLFDALREAIGEPAVAAVRNAGELRPLTIGLSELSPFEEAHSIELPPQAVAAYREAQRRLEDLGHRLEEAEFDYSGYPENFRKGWTAGLSLIELSDEDEDKLSSFTREYRRAAIARGREENEAAGAWLRNFAESVREQWGQYDVVLTPGLGLVPPKIGEFFERDADYNYRLQCEYAPYTSMVNVSGLPAIGVPILRTPTDDDDVVAHGKRAPQWSWGIQLIGKSGSEELLLQLAQLLTGGDGTNRW